MEGHTAAETAIRDSMTNATTHSRLVAGPFSNTRSCPAVSLMGASRSSVGLLSGLSLLTMSLILPATPDAVGHETVAPADLGM